MIKLSIIILGSKPLRPSWEMVRKILLFRKVFFGIISPTLNGPSPFGYQMFMAVSQSLLFGMFAGLWIFLFYLSKFDFKKEIGLLYWLLLIFLFSIYAMGMPERRYLYFIEFIIVINFFVTLDNVYSTLVKRR